MQDFTRIYFDPVFPHLTNIWTYVPLPPLAHAADPLRDPHIPNSVNDLEFCLSTFELAATFYRLSPVHVPPGHTVGELARAADRIRQKMTYRKEKAVKGQFCKWRNWSIVLFFVLLGHGLLVLSDRKELWILHGLAFLFFIIRVWRFYHETKYLAYPPQTLGPVFQKRYRYINLMHTVGGIVLGGCIMLAKLINGFFQDSKRRQTSPQAQFGV